MVDRNVEWFERTFFGGYTGSPEGRRQFHRDQLLKMGFRSEIVDQTLRKEDERLRRAGETW